MKMKTCAIVSVIAMLGMYAQSASASVVVKTFKFTATGFADIIPSSVTPPVDPVSGLVTVAFDPVPGFVGDQTTGITLDSLNLPLGSPIAFSYNGWSDTLYIGGLNAGATGVIWSDDDFMLSIRHASTTPVGDYLTYSTSGAAMAYTTSTVSVSAVPEPAVWGLMMVGFGLIGTALRSRVRKVVPAV